MTARPRNALRHLLLPLVAAPLLVAIILRPDLGMAGVDYDLNCLLDLSCVPTEAPPDTPTPPINPTPDSCLQAEEGGRCVDIGNSCGEETGGSASCNRTGSASCIDGACNVTANNDQILAAGGYLDWFSNWFTTPDGAWEIRFYESPVCQNSSGIAQCSTYQIRAAAATAPDTPATGDGGGDGGGGAYCGDGTCNGGETCSTCPKDCGFCPGCGIGICGAGQTCQTCPVGCGICTGDVTARAVYMENPAPTCDEVRAASSTNGLTFTHALTRSNDYTITKVQSGVSYVTFPFVPVDVISLSITPSTILPMTRVCYRKSNPSEDGYSLYTNLASGQSIQFDVAFGPQTPFFQTQGGNVYANGSITSVLPTTLAPRFFHINPLVGSPGVVGYGSDATGYDFSIEPGSDYGRTLVSSTGWLVHDSISKQLLYEKYSHRVLSGAQPKHEYDPIGSSYSKPGAVEGEDPTIYTYNIDSTLSDPLIIGDIAHTPWVVGDGEKIIIVANSDVTIRSPITITGNGFFSIIAKGTISIDPSVGGAWNSSVPVLEGIYVAGTEFKTGVSSIAGTERLVIRGSVMADKVTLERNLSDIEGVNRNETTSAELFIHSPRLVLSTPDLLNDRNYLWQEVSP